MKRISIIFPFIVFASAHSFSFPNILKFLSDGARSISSTPELELGDCVKKTIVTQELHHPSAISSQSVATTCTCGAVTGYVTAQFEQHRYYETINKFLQKNPALKRYPKISAWITSITFGTLVFASLHKPAQAGRKQLESFYSRYSDTEQK